MKKSIVYLLLLLLAACSRGGEATTSASEAPEIETSTAVDTGTAVSTPADNITNITEPVAAEETDTRTLRMIAYDWELGNYRDLIETFEAENLGVEIKMVSLEETLGLESGGVGQWPEDAAERLVSAADIITTNAVGSVDGSSGLLLDLRPLLEADPTFDRNDFYPNALEYFESDGGVWGMPTLLNFTLIFYNKDAFDAAGLDYPQAGWSWDDLLAAAQATTVREGDQVVQWGLIQSGRNPVEMVLPRTGPLIDATTDPPTPRFDRPEVAAALQWFVDLYLLHEVAPNLSQPEPDENGVFIPPEFELIETGKAAMWPEWSGSWQWRSSQMNIGAVPFPIDAPDDRTNPVFVSGYMVSAGTRHPEVAWRWINFLSQQPVAEDLSHNSAVPARRSVAEASGFWDRVDPELGQALRYAIDHAYFNRFVPGYGPFFEAVRAIFDGEQTTEAALAAAQAQAEVNIAEFLAEQEETEDVDIVISIPEEEAVPEGAVTIIFTAGNSLQPYRDLAQTFQEQHPDIVVELVTPDFGNGSIGLHDVAAVSDCLQWYGGVTNEDERAAVLSLEPFLDADPELSKDDFYPQAVDVFSYQGQLWGLPAEINVSVIMYNKALFDAADMPYPQLNWTTDEFLATAIALTEGDDPETKQYGYVPQEFEINDLTAFLERLGAQFLDESEDPPKLSFTHPATIEAMRWVTNLTTEFGIKPTFRTSIGGTFDVGVGEERKALIENGRAAMWSDQGFESFPEISLDDIDVGVAPLPAGPDGTATPSNASTGYFISAGTEQRQACWRWIKFLDEQPFIGSYGNTIPARQSVAESAAYTQAVGSEQAAANLASIENVTGPSVSLRLSTDANWLGLGHFWWQSYAYDQVIKAGVSVEEALAEVQAKADAYRNCVIERNGFTDNNIQRACLGEVDDTVPPSFVEVDDEE